MTLHETEKAAEITISGRRIGPAHPPFVIAELSGNHNQSIDRARWLIDAAAKAGADAVKLQTYTPDTITLAHDGPGFRIEKGLWAGRTLHDLYAEAYTPYDWHAGLFEHARSQGLIIFSTPFDATAVDLLRDLDAPAYKIASFEAVDLPLIERAAAARRPLIISTGMTTAEEISDAVASARAGGADGIALLHCVSAYPAEFRDANLRAIPRLARDYGCVAGLSDHTPGTAAAVAGVALGAALVEKHFTLARADGGPDSAFSLEPEEFIRLVGDCRNAWEALGGDSLERAPDEKANLQFRRSLYLVRDVPEGKPLTADDVRSIRPGYGLPPRHLPSVLGRTARRPLARGEPLDWSMLDPPL